LPFVENETFKMVKYRLPLKKDKFKIMTPNNSKLKITKVDLAIVPILGIDKTFRRIGFGKGMYDRFFANLDNSPIKVFVQLTAIFSEEIITEKHDIQADYFISGD
jgi:5-formyltetrahydrofolate cyclo-ligase